MSVITCTRKSRVQDICSKLEREYNWKPEKSKFKYVNFWCSKWDFLRLTQLRPGYSTETRPNINAYHRLLYNKSDMI